MINIALKPGTVTDAMFGGQAALQQIILLIVFITVPLMLCVKPVLLNNAEKAAIAAHQRAKDSDASEQSELLAAGTAAAAVAAAGAGVQVAPSAEAAATKAAPHSHDSKADSGHAANEPHAHGFGELFIHQAIETIEFVLGSVSNTASYLRLWALSLAHSQLATVFWERALVMTIEMDSTVFVVIGYAVWMALTFAVLMVSLKL